MSKYLLSLYLEFCFPLLHQLLFLGLLAEQALRHVSLTEKTTYEKLSDKFTGLLDYCNDYCNLLLAIYEPVLLGSPPSRHESACTPGLTPLDMSESVHQDSPPSGAG
jgi:hypothetical protein